MHEEIINAGFGGQGVMSMGKIMAYAAMKEGKEVSWMPSYGPEMRGGTANSTVIISSKKIASPLTSHPDTVIAMNLPSLIKFMPKIKPGGKLFVNSSLINTTVKREDIEIVKIPANEIARELGNDQIANMVMLGAYVNRTKILDINKIKNALKEVFPARRHNLIPLNIQALDQGAILQQQLTNLTV